MRLFEWICEGIETMGMGAAVTLLVIGVLVLLAQGGCLPNLPDTGGCIRGCNTDTQACLDGASLCADTCGDDSDCALGCKDRAIDCIGTALTCLADCAEEIEEALD